MHSQQHMHHCREQRRGAAVATAAAEVLGMPGPALGCVQDQAMHAEPTFIGGNQMHGGGGGGGG